MIIEFRGYATLRDKWVYGFLNINKAGIYFIKNKAGVMYVVDPESVGQYTNLDDNKGKRIYGAVGKLGGDIVKDTINVRIGTKVSGRGRNQTTYAIHEKKECFGVVEFYNIKYQIKWDAYDDYMSYFFVSSSKDSPRHRRDQITKDLYKELIVAGNAFQNIGLLEGKP